MKAKVVRKNREGESCDQRVEKREKREKWWNWGETHRQYTQTDSET